MPSYFYLSPITAVRTELSRHDRFWTKPTLENKPVRIRINLVIVSFFACSKSLHKYLFISYFLISWRKWWDIRPSGVAKKLNIDKSWLPQKTTAKKSLNFIPIKSLETKKMAPCRTKNIAMIYRCINWLNYEKFMISNCSSLFVEISYFFLFCSWSFPCGACQSVLGRLPVYYLSLIFHNLTIIQIC